MASKRRVSMKIDRQLVQVNFVSWVPWEARQARQGQLDAHAKEEVIVQLWAPFPVDDNGRPDPSLMKPEEQGMLWAQNEVIRTKPDGREVLAIVGVAMLGVRESRIMSSKPDPSADDKEGTRRKSSLILT